MRALPGETEKPSDGPIPMMALAHKLALIPMAAVLAVGDASGQVPRPPQVQPVRDGQHDFDWEHGIWATKVRVLRNPLSGAAPDWAQYQGTSLVRPILGGRYNLVELSVRGAAGRIEGASLRLYEPQSRRWTLNYANVRDGLLTTPVGGSFDGHGRGIFYADDTLNRRPIKVRFVISVVSNAAAHFEQAYSADGGSSWELNWIADDTRVPTAQRRSTRQGFMTEPARRQPNTQRKRLLRRSRAP
jgi:hypothetical protein